IGRSGGYDLAVDAEPSIYPPTPRHHVLLVQPFALPALLLGVLFGAAMLAFGRITLSQRRYQALETNAPEPLTFLRSRWGELARLGLGFSVFAFALLGAARIFLWVGRNRADEEPFEWMEGVSAWPSGLLLLAAGLLCVWFISRMLGDLVANTNR